MKKNCKAALLCNGKFIVRALIPNTIAPRLSLAANASSNCCGIGERNYN